MEVASLDTDVHSERPVIKGLRFDLAVCSVRDGSGYLGVWYCSECWQRNVTGRFSSQIVAYQAAEDAMTVHVDEHHDTGREAGA